MTSQNKQWQNVKENYLKLIEKKLAHVDHPRRAEILDNVREHLDNKYAELYPEQQNWESFQQIITEMGPPEEYAELLTENHTPTAKTTSGVNTFLAILFVIVLAAVGGYLIYAAKKTPSQPLPVKQSEFEMDERVLGKWVTVDFVHHIDDFDPAKKHWPGDLFLKSLVFNDDGIVACSNIKVKAYEKRWTEGKVSPDEDRPAFYYLRNIDGQTYLFYEWVSGDVTERGREPAYYVLKQFKDNESVVPTWFDNDPQAIGYWAAVDFVETVEDFGLEHQQTSDLFLKTLHFEDNGKLLWTVDESAPIALDWTKGIIRPFDVLPATYSIKQMNTTDYLFYEYRTCDSKPAGYYVFKRAQTKEATRKTPQLPFVNDPQVLGQWNTVDFIRTLDAFNPHLKSWQGELWVKKLNFKEQGIVKWCLGEDQMKANHRWTKGKLLDDELPSRYFIETYEDGDYLFMEWNSGDVTIRGQKPCYYVLKKEE